MLSKSNPKALVVAVTKAREVVEAERAKLAQLEADQAATEAELVSLQSRAGAEALDDPAAMQTLPRKMQELRDRIEITGAAATAQKPRVTVAEQTYLLAEADVLAEPIPGMEAELERHEARTAELLSQLEKHEGAFVLKVLLDNELARNFVGTREVEVPRSEQIQTQIFRAGLPVLVLRELAAGRDPQVHPTLRTVVPAEVYPACVFGPAALVPAPAYLRSVAAQRSADQQRQVATETARRRISELEGAIARGETSSPSLQDWTLGKEPSLPEQLEQAHRLLAELLSDPVSA